MSGGLEKQSKQWPQMANGRGQQFGTPNFGNASAGGAMAPNMPWGAGGQTSPASGGGWGSQAWGGQPRGPVVDPTSQGVPHFGMTATGGIMQPPGFNSGGQEPLQSPGINSTIPSEPLQGPSMNPQANSGLDQFRQRLNQQFAQGGNSPYKFPGLANFGNMGSKGAPGIGALAQGGQGNQGPMRDPLFMRNPDIGNFGGGQGQQGNGMFMKPMPRFNAF